MVPCFFTLITRHTLIKTRRIVSSFNQMVKILSRMPPTALTAMLPILLLQICSSYFFSDMINGTDFNLIFFQIISVLMVHMFNFKRMLESLEFLQKTLIDTSA